MAELQDIFRDYGRNYREKYKLTLVRHKAMSAIQNCRTSQLGGHKDVCESCGDIKISYNSCRNRHCPKCQTLAKERWIENQKSNLLNIGYFHVVFTLPDTLNLMIYQNQKKLYTLLFKASSETLAELASDKKYLGAKLGFTSILHTWGQKTLCTIRIFTASYLVEDYLPSANGSTAEKSFSSRLKFYLVNSEESSCITSNNYIMRTSLNFMVVKNFFPITPSLKNCFLCYIPKSGLSTVNRLIKMQAVLLNILVDILTELPSPTIVSLVLKMILSHFNGVITRAVVRTSK